MPASVGVTPDGKTASAESCPPCCRADRSVPLVLRGGEERAVTLAHALRRHLYRNFSQPSRRACVWSALQETWCSQASLETPSWGALEPLSRALVSVLAAWLSSRCGRSFVRR